LFNKIMRSEESSASESASEINTGVLLYRYSGINRQPLVIRRLAVLLV
jgi:hypothetical protein